ncbi:hypothetical protein ACTA71_009464 [Dictyostelium dimigraforme]
MIVQILPGENTLLITENDLGKGFSIDENGCNAKKGPVLIFNKEQILTTPGERGSSELTLIRNDESIKSVFGLKGELSLSYGLISNKIIGDYIQTTTSKPSDDILKVGDIDTLRSLYGFYYISKIEYGAILDLKITLESSDKNKMDKIKGELGVGNISFGAFSSSIGGFLEREEHGESSRLRVTSSVISSGNILQPSWQTSFKHSGAKQTVE